MRTTEQLECIKKCMIMLHMEQVTMIHLFGIKYQMK
jgi:hypothetical protein